MIGDVLVGGFLPIQSLLLFSLAIFLAYFFLSGFIWGAGYYPTSKREVDSIAELIGLDPKLKEKQRQPQQNSLGVPAPAPPHCARLYDLGSGFGGIIFSIAERYETRCVGVEIDPLKYWWSKLSARRRRLGNSVELICGNILKVDLSGADAVFVFLSAGTKVMEKLREKMFAEMRPGSKVVSYTHRFHNWEPEKIQGKLTLYSIPERSTFCFSRQAQ